MIAVDAASAACSHSSRRHNAAARRAGASGTVEASEAYTFTASSYRPCANSASPPSIMDVFETTSLRTKRPDSIRINAQSINLRQNEIAFNG